MIETPKVKLVNDETEELLGQMHTLLIAHRYDYLLGELLRELLPLIPGAEDHCEALNAGKTDSEVKPKALAVVDGLLDLEASHVQEALCLGYRIGLARVTPVEIVNPSAKQVINHLGLTRLMEYNLSFGYVITERATARLEASRSPCSG